LVEIYKLWHEYIQHFPKNSKYTLGSKIDALFLEVIELLFSASYLAKQEKLPVITKASNILDLLKFFLQIAWEAKALDNKKYITLSEKLNEIGKMLGGWRKQLLTQIPFK
jgi:predicted membrane chloride channel (bestrophin family)